MAPPPTISQPGGLAATPTHSAELDVPDGGLLADGACGVLCEQLLAGGMDWLRIVDRRQDGESQVIRRVPAAECRALDADFPDTAPCLLAMPDDGAAADLRVELRRSFTRRETHSDGFAALVSTTRLTLTDSRSGRLLHDERANVWARITMPPHLMASAEFNGFGRNGVFVQRENRADPMPDLTATLAALGQPLAPPRPMVETRNHRGPKRLADAPQDTALVLSLLALHPGELRGPVAAQVSRWMQGLGNGRFALAADRAALAAVARRKEVEHEVDTLMRMRPDLFGASVAEYYRIIREGTTAEAERAARTLVNIVLYVPPGTYAEDADGYLATLASRRNWGDLILLAGRYGLDPVPVLRAELAAAPRDRTPVSALLEAACHADPRWDTVLAPVVHELMLPMAENPMIGTYPGFTDRISIAAMAPRGTRALLRMGREDLVLDLYARAAWEALRPPGGFMTPRLSADRVRSLYLGSLTDKRPC